MVLLVQASSMAALYGSRLLGTGGSGLLNLAIWLLLPFVAAVVACSLLTKGAGWKAAGRHRDVLRVSVTIGLPLLAMFVGAFASLNTFGE
jgi:hypothetical protein